MLENVLDTADVVREAMFHQLIKDVGQEKVSKAPFNEDVRDIVNFLDLLLLYAYDLPKKVADYRRRRDS